MKRFQSVTAAVAFAAVAFAIAMFAAADASAGHPYVRHHDRGHHGHAYACCVCRQKVCHLEVDQEEVDVNCLDVECEDVCIPPVRFWWECGPIDRCGKVRTVAKLTTDSYTTTECTYDWSVKTICRGCYRKVHRLRCHQLGLGPDATPEQLGLPTPAPLTDPQSDDVVGFRLPQPVQIEEASFEPGGPTGMLTGDEPIAVADVSAFAN